MKLKITAVHPTDNGQQISYDILKDDDTKCGNAYTIVPFGSTKEQVSALLKTAANDLKTKFAEADTFKTDNSTVNSD